MSESANVCPVCGGTEFSWGNLQIGTELANVGFRPEEAGLLQRVFSAADQVSVRHCQGCENLQLFLSR